MKNKNILSQTILSQTNKFTVSQIISMTGVSNVYVSQTLQKLQAEGLIMRVNKGKPQLWKVMAAKDSEASKLNVATRFEYIRNLVDMVIKGVQPSVLITGQPGIGKSYIVKSQLEKAGKVINDDYLQISGHSSPLGLYRLLHDHRDAMIVFDDCDSVLNDDISKNILKAALDSYDKRWVSWYSSKAEQQDLDPSFEFTGRIVFISNMYADRIDQAVRSRAFCFDLQMSNSEISEHMGNILEFIEPKVSIDLRKEVLEYLKTIQDKFRQYSLRTLIQAIRIRSYTVDTRKDWKSMVQVLACEA